MILIWWWVLSIGAVIEKKEEENPKILSSHNIFVKDIKSKLKKLKPMTFNCSAKWWSHIITNYMFRCYTSAVRLSAKVVGVNDLKLNVWALTKKLRTLIKSFYKSSRLNHRN